MSVRVAVKESQPICPDHPDSTSADKAKNVGWSSRGMTSVADPDPIYMDLDPAFQFDTDPDLLSNLIWLRIRQFDTDPEPYHFKEVMSLKQYFLYIFASFSLSVGPTGPT